MPSLDTAVIVLPLALVFYTNRILNPAVVVVEVFLNFYVLFINRGMAFQLYGKECFRFSSGCCRASQ